MQTLNNTGAPVKFDRLPAYLKLSVPAIAIAAGIASFLLSWKLMLDQSGNGFETLNNTLITICFELTKSVSGAMIAISFLYGWRTAAKFYLFVFSLCAMFSLYASFSYLQLGDARSNSLAMTQDSKFQDLQGQAKGIDSQIGTTETSINELQSKLNQLSPTKQPGNYRQLSDKLATAQGHLSQLQSARAEVGGNVQAFQVAAGSALSPGFIAMAGILKSDPESIRDTFFIFVAILLELVIYAAGYFSYTLWRARNADAFGDGEESEYESKKLLSNDNGETFTDGQATWSKTGNNPGKINVQKAAFGGDIQPFVAATKLKQHLAKQNHAGQGFSYDPTHGHTVKGTLKGGDHKKTCENCGQGYMPKVDWQRFCSKNCKNDYHGFSPKKKAGSR